MAIKTESIPHPQNPKTIKVIAAPNTIAASINLM
jgi:hypothetical protein